MIAFWKVISVLANAKNADKAVTQKHIPILQIIAEPICWEVHRAQIQLTPIMKNAIVKEK